VNLVIEHIALECLLPGGPDLDSASTAAIRDKITAAACNELPRALAQVFTRGAGGEGMSFVDTLRFDAHVDAGWTPQQIADAIASQIADSLRSALEESDSVRFLDRPDLLARFIAHLAYGKAFRHHWHREFEGLKHLPVSAALRTLVERDPLEALAALARLADADLPRIIALLSRTDALRAAQAFLRHSGPACRDGRAISRVLIEGGFIALSESRDRILFAVKLWQRAAAYADGETILVAQVLCRAMAGAVSPRDGPAASGGRAGLSIEVAHIEAADIEAVLAGLAIDTSPQELAACRSFDPHILREILSLATHRAPAMAGDASLWCAHCGLWLLLAHVLEQLPKSMSIEDREMLAFGALTCMLGGGAGAVWSDPVLRAQLRIPREDGDVAARLASSSATLRDLTDDTLGEPRRSFAQRRTDMRFVSAAGTAVGLPRRLLRLAMRVAYRALRAYAHRLPGFSTSSCSYLVDNFVAIPGRVSAQEHVDVVLMPPPLDVIWRMTGAGQAQYALPSGSRVRAGVQR